jgi:hypothetical protein
MTIADDIAALRLIAELRLIEPTSAIVVQRVGSITRVLDYLADIERQLKSEMRAAMHVWVLMKQRGEEARPHAVYKSYDELLARIYRIEANPNNKGYRLRSISKDGSGRAVGWTLGPEHDEGFFGDHPIRFTAVEVGAPK